MGKRPSGIAGVVTALVEHLPTLAPDWHFKFLHQSSLGQPLSDAPNVTEIPVNAAANGPTTMWRLPSVVNLGNVDLFHAPANILPRGLSMPCVTTIHDLMWLTEPQMCSRSLWGQIERRFYSHGIKHALERSDAIVTVSEATRSDVVDLKPGLAGRTFTALSGVSDAFNPGPVDPDILGPLGLLPQQYVLTVGQNAPYKNHEGAIRGFALAFANNSEIDLVILQRRGQGTRRLKRLAESLGIEAKVHFLPPLEGSSLPQLYRGALALLHPSFKEGFGMPLAEAMACGCPVVTSNCSAMPEVTGDAALLIDPHSPETISAALKRLVADPEHTNALRQRGIERAAELDWREFAARNLEVYRKVLESA